LLRILFIAFLAYKLSAAKTQTQIFAMNACLNGMFKNIHGSVELQVLVLFVVWFMLKGVKILKTKQMDVEVEFKPD
jgi:hypothetical protein